MTLPHSLKTARRLLRRARSMWSSHSGRKPFFSSSFARRLISPEPVHHLSPSFSVFRNMPACLNNHFSFVSIGVYVFMIKTAKFPSAFFRQSLFIACIYDSMYRSTRKVGHSKKNNMLLGEERNVDMKVEFWSDLSIGQWMTICGLL